MIHEIRKPFPVKVTSKDDAEATAMFMLDYSQEHDTLFGVFLRSDGSFWWVPAPEIRVFDNWSLGRVHEIGKKMFTLCVKCGAKGYWTRDPNVFCWSKTQKKPDGTNAMECRNCGLIHPDDFDK